MNVDISPYLPPSSSWTADAPIGSGSDGGGISVCRRSILRITDFFLVRTLSKLDCPLTPCPNNSSTARMDAMSAEPDEAGECCRPGDAQHAPAAGGRQLR